MYIFFSLHKGKLNFIKICGVVALRLESSTGNQTVMGLNPVNAGSDSTLLAP